MHKPAVYRSYFGLVISGIILFLGPGCGSMNVTTQTNVAPVISVFTPAGYELSGDVDVIFDLYDQNDDTCVIRVEYRGGAVTQWTDADVEGDLTSVKSGDTYQVTWHSGIDQDDITSDNYRLRLVANDGQVDGAPKLTGPFGVYNHIYWRNEQTLQSMSQTWPASPQVGIDMNSCALALWTESLSGQGSIMSSRYIPGLGWGGQEPVEFNDQYEMSSPHMDMNTVGTAVASWQSLKSVWVNRYDPIAGWGATDIIDENPFTEDIKSTGAVIAEDGTAVVLWTEDDAGGDSDVWWAVNDPQDSTWSLPERIYDLSDGIVMIHSMKISTNGRIVALLGYGTETMINDLKAIVYEPGSGWQAAPEAIESRPDAIYGAGLAMDSSGNAMAVWSQSNGTANQVWANFYTGTWHGDVQVSNSASGAWSCSVAMDESQNTFLAWTESPMQISKIMTSRYLDASGWSAPEVLFQGNAGNWSGDPKVLMNSSGKISVLYALNGAWTDLWCKTYKPDTGWLDPVLVEQGSGNVNEHVADMCRQSAKIAAVWFSSDAYNTNVVANVKR